MPTPHPDRCCAYKIGENTAGELLGVAAAPPPYVVRWADTGPADQKWVIVPLAGDACRLVNCANGEYMAVGDDGFLVRWEYLDEPEQTFSFVNPSGDWWNIRAAGGRYVTVVLPWGPGVARLNTQPLLRGAAEQKYQQFRLIPVDEKARPALQPGQYEPGAIPDVPRIEAFGRYPPETSPPEPPYYLIGETILPATLVDDPALPDVVLRVRTSPYYILRREQYWDRTRCSHGDPCLYEHDGHSTKHYETEITYGYSSAQSHQMEATTGTKFSAEGKIVFSPRVSAAVSYAVQNELKVQQSTASDYQESIRVRADLDIPAERFVICNWVLVNRYTLLNMSRVEVRHWDVAQYGVLVSDGYPRKLGVRGV